MITAKDMSRAIITGSDRFGCRQNFLVIENVSWGLFEWGECDLLVLSKSLYATEVEIKISISDLKNDFTKKKWNKTYSSQREKQIKKFYYAIPVEILDKAIGLILSNKPQAGIISVDYKKELGRAPVIKITKESGENPRAEKFEEEKVLNLARLAMFRYWRAA